MTLFRPCITSVGPKNARIVAVGEAPGEQEERTGIPFIGASGQEFDRMLLQAGLSRAELYLTNVLWTRPPNNKLEAFCVKKGELPSSYSLPPLSQGKYLHPDFIPELERLFEELRSIRPNLILLLGATAAWAVLGQGKISTIRGAIAPSAFGKCLPTFHPAVVFRDWSARPIIVADLLKAAREQHYPEIRRPIRHVLVDPTLEETLDYLSLCLSGDEVSVDVETFRGAITELGIGRSPSEAISIPFYVPPPWRSAVGKTPGNYWTLAEELKVRRAINTLLSSERPRKIMQNGLYDIQYLLAEGYRLRSCADDTMLAQHALHPEIQKSLGFMGSIYTDEVAWKLMRTAAHTLKRED